MAFFLVLIDGVYGISWKFSGIRVRRSTGSTED